MIGRETDRNRATVLSRETDGTTPRQPAAWLTRLPLHYGWIVVIVGVLVTASCLGVARFAFSMILPSMGEGLDLSRQQMGIIGTAGFVGYLVGALSSGRLGRWIGARRTIVGSLVLIALTILMVAAAQNFWQVLIVFALTGIGSGAGNVASMGLVSHWFLRSMRGRASGLVVTGSGYAIMITGLLIPVINDRFGAAGWRIGWVVLAAMVTATAALAALFTRNTPRDVGVEPVGHAVHDAIPHVEAGPAEQRRATIHLGAIYALFGLSYIIYMTFLVTSLVRDRGLSEETAGRFWFIIGLLSIFSGPIFGVLSDRAGRRRGFAAAFACHAIAFALVGLPLPIVSVYASVILFGLSAWSIPGIMGAAAGDYMGPAKAAQALGTLTVFFGVGQVIGPTLAGSLAESSGSFASSYLLASAFAVVAAVLSLTLRPPRPMVH